MTASLTRFAEATERKDIFKRFYKLRKDRNWDPDSKVLIYPFLLMADKWSFTFWLFVVLFLTETAED